MIRAMKKKEGFTLVELLIVVAIIGILAAIAIPQMSLYRAKAFCASMESDLSNWAKAQEAYFVDNQTYTTSATTDDPPGFKPTNGVTITAGTINAQGFDGTATHAQCVDSAGTQLTYTYESTAGGIRKQ